MALRVCKLAYANVVFDLDGSTESEIWFQTSGYKGTSNVNSFSTQVELRSEDIYFVVMQKIQIKN